MPKYSERKKRKLYEEGIKLGEKGLTKTKAAKELKVGKKFFNNTKEEFPDLPSWPEVNKRSVAGAINSYTKEQFMEKYNKAVEHYKSNPVSIHGSCKHAGMGRDTFIKYAKEYDLMDLPEYVGGEALFDDKADKPAICPKLYALAFMAVGGFSRGMGYQYEDLVNG